MHSAWYLTKFCSTGWGCVASKAVIIYSIGSAALHNAVAPVPSAARKSPWKRRSAPSAPDIDEVLDGTLQALVKVVLPHDGGHAWVREDVSIASLLLAMWEGPVLLRAACVMVVNEGHCSGGPPAHQTCSSQPEHSRPQLPH